MSGKARIALALTGSLGPGLFRGLYATLRFDVVGGEHLDATWRAGQPVVFVTWHGRLLPLLYLFRAQGIVMLVSQHRDGEYLTRLGRGIGFDAVRGSSTRGGASALRELVRRLEAGQSLAITPDGPQGPRERFKPGALQAARLAGTPVIPVMAGGGPTWWVEGWDRFMVPKPFARVNVAVGAPQYVAPDVGSVELAAEAERLESLMNRLKAAVDG